MKVIYEKSRAAQRGCGHARRRYAVLICSNGAPQVRNTCVDCGKRSNDPQPLNLHPKWRDYPEIRRHDGAEPAKTQTDYEAYLASPEWAARRAYYVAKALHRCQLCNAEGGPGGKGLNVHHRTYERLAAELDADVVVLCRPCHRRHHGVMEKAA